MNTAVISNEQVIPKKRGRKALLKNFYKQIEENKQNQRIVPKWIPNNS